MKKIKKKKILFKTVKEDNILPITSVCKLNCIFCSHKNNPSEIETYRFGHLDKNLIKTMIEFLDPEQPVFIGESASKIVEGEPFVHPDIYQILKYLRQRWPRIEIKITSSGSFIDPEKLKLLKSLNPLELNISLNAPAPEERVFLMNDSNPENVFEIIKKMKELKMRFEASIVSMHHLKGFEYLKKTFEFLEDYSPETLRVFMAGFSKYADSKISSDSSEYKKLNTFINSVKADYSYPIIIEPQLLDNLKAEINDIINNSPAAKTELYSGDVIKEVNDKKVKSRVDAFYQIKSSKNPKVKIHRNNKNKIIHLKKGKNEKSGLILSYDLSIEEIKTLKAYAVQAEKNNDKIVILASEAGYSLLYSLLKDYLTKNFKLIEVENKFFGASIIAAGLLTNEDLIRVLQKEIKKASVDKIILPKIIYDYYGNDLLGKHYNQLEDKFRAEVILI